MTCLEDVLVSNWVILGLVSGRVRHVSVIPGPGDGGLRFSDNDGLEERELPCGVRGSVLRVKMILKSCFGHLSGLGHLGGHQQIREHTASRLCLCVCVCLHVWYSVQMIIIKS